MAKKAKSEMTAAEATRKAWQELGKDAAGTEVGKLVRTKYEFDVPSSTISMAKAKVFGGGAKKAGKKAAVAPKKSAPSDLPVQLMSKTDVVKDLLAKGLNMPVEIAAAAKELGHEITPSYVSMIKTNLKKAGGKKGKPGRKPGRTLMAGTTSAARVVGATVATGDLELENLALRFALKAGSVEAAVAALEKLR